MANKNAKNAVNGTDIFVVTPSNMGKGLVWNDQTKQYEVNIGEGLRYDDTGAVQAVPSKPVIKTFDNGSGKIVHKQVIIDSGVTIEVSGTIVLPLAPVRLVGKDTNDPEVVAERERLSRLYGGGQIGWVVPADGHALGLLNSTDHTALFQTESIYVLPLKELGISQVLSATATAGDVRGYRKETAWIVNNITENQETIPIGVHTYYNDEQESCAVSYAVKGLKA